MSLKLKLEKKIREKEQEISNLKMALSEAQAYLQATQDALRLLPRSGVEKKASQAKIRVGTTLDRARYILKRANKPMHVMDILAAMGKEKTSENRQSLVGSIGTYARKGVVFVKKGPNTFGLLEWRKNNEENEEMNNLPEDFGLR